jgi:hypothetical protein
VKNLQKPIKPACLDPKIAFRLRIIDLHKNKRVSPMEIAKRLGATNTFVSTTLQRDRSLQENIQSGTLLAAGFNMQAVLWISRVIGVKNATETHVKRWLKADPANAYRLRNSKHGIELLDYAIAKLGVKPTLADLGMTTSGIKLAGWLTGKEYPYRSDLAKWFTDHPNKEKRKQMILKVRRRRGLAGDGEKDVFELEIFARNHMRGGD